jgi:hypothetical protein
VDAALLCQSCAWFGVYRREVTNRMSACPICGCTDLSVRGVDDDDWRALGQQLLEEPEPNPT